jgi:hypothetical protein
MRIDTRFFTPLLIAAAAASSIALAPIAAAQPGTTPSCAGTEIAVNQRQGTSLGVAGQSTVLQCWPDRYQR